MAVKKEPVAPAPVVSDKKKALETAMQQIEKMYGKGSIMRYGAESTLNVESIPTGSLSLDLALGIGGLPRGRIVEIYGPESSGKTTLALHILAEAQKKGGEVAFIDVEHALDPTYAEALGVNINASKKTMERALREENICFMFAQKYHSAMKYVAPIRKELGIRTVFNILGPLSNPAGANMELMGVYDESLVEPLARVMANLGVVRGMVVYGQDKLDEISMCAPTTVCEIKDGTFTSYEITPEQFGYERCEKGVLTGGTPQENAQITLDIISGKELGAKRNAVCLNAGAAIYLAGKADSIEAGVRKAEQIIDEGLALKKLEQFKEESNK